MIELVLKKPLVTLLVFGLVVIGIGHRAIFIKQDNSPDALFAADREATELYHQMVKTFGTDEMVLIQLRGARSTSVDDLYNLARLTRRIAKLPGVDDVFSASQIFDLEYDEKLEKPTAETVKLIHDEVAKISLYRELGIVRDDVPALAVAAMITMRGLGARTAFNRALKKVMDEFRQAGYTPLVAGLTPTNAAIEREGQRVQTVFMPLVAVLIVIIGWALFRSLLAIVVMAIPVGGSILLLIGGLEIFGQHMSLMNSVLPQMLLVIGFAGAIHIVSRYGAWMEQGKTAGQAVGESIREKIVPTAFAFGTTAIGFGTLAFSDVKPVRVLGLAASAAIFFSLLFVVFITPCLLLLFKPKVHVSERRHRWLETTAELSLKHRWVVLTAATLCALFIAGGIPQIDTRITALEMLGNRVPEKKAFVQLEKEGYGLGNVDVWIHTKVPDYKAVLDAARRLEKLSASLRQIDRITAVVSIVQELQVFNMRTNRRPGLPEGLMVLKLADKEELKKLDKKLGYFWHRDKGLKVIVLSRSAKEDEIRQLCTVIERQVKVFFPGAKVDLTGHYLMMLGTPGSLLRTLGSSLTVTVIVIGILFMLAFRLPGMALAAMVTNVLPVAVVVGSTGWLGIPLDVATVMVGSIGFGLAVDNSFHYLHHYKQEKSVIRAAHICGKGIVGTSILLSFGFLVLGMSGFNPVMRFGVFTALAVLSAMVANAFLLPAFVGKRSELDQPKEDTSSPAVVDGSSS
ncbi:MAG: MMPL family transporter [Myxococcales bacterium]|nr:MMPL family transporter [Myxococcales bacterium]